MNQDKQTLGLSSQPSTSSGEAEVKAFHEPPAIGLGVKVLLVAFALIAGFAGAYGWLQHNTAQQFASSRNELTASLGQARSQIDSLSAKINAMTAAQAQEEAARAEAQKAKEEEAARQAAVPRRTSVRNRAAKPAADDPRWQQMQLQLGEQQRQLADNKQQIAETQASLDQAKSALLANIQSTRSELNGSIARNHDELVALEKKGERNFYEFDIRKGKSFQHAGPVSISVRKANDSHGYCDLQMVVNDQELSRKHVDLYESVAFYPEGSPLPVEVVINRIGKDFVQGYVSEPKVRAPEKATAASPANSAAPASTTASINAIAPNASDIKLERRQPEDAH